MKTTPELLKARRKRRRERIRQWANLAIDSITGDMCLKPAPKTYYRKVGDIEEKFTIHGFSVGRSDTIALATLVRFGRRITPLIDCAKRELDRRYRDETFRRRRELKKKYKAAVMAKIAGKAKAEGE